MSISQSVPVCLYDFMCRSTSSILVMEFQDCRADITTWRRRTVPGITSAQTWAWAVEPTLSAGGLVSRLLVTYMQALNRKIIIAIRMVTRKRTELLGSYLFQVMLPFKVYISEAYISGCFTLAVPLWILYFQIITSTVLVIGSFLLTAPPDGTYPVSTARTTSGPRIVNGGSSAVIVPIQTVSLLDRQCL